MLNVFPIHHIEQSAKYEKNPKNDLQDAFKLKYIYFVYYVYYEIPKIEYSGGIKNRFPQKRQGKN